MSFDHWFGTTVLIIWFFCTSINDYSIFIKLLTILPVFTSSKMLFVIFSCRHFLISAPKRYWINVYFLPVRIHIVGCRLFIQQYSQFFPYTFLFLFDFPPLQLPLVHRFNTLPEFWKYTSFGKNPERMRKMPKNGWKKVSWKKLFSTAHLMTTCTTVWRCSVICLRQQKWKNNEKTQKSSSNIKFLRHRPWRLIYDFQST